MNEILDEIQAGRLLDELHAYRRHKQREREEAWMAHADTLPHLRVWLANLTHSSQENVQNALDMARAMREYGALVAERSGVSMTAQFFQQLRLYDRHRVPADSFYFLRMYERGARKKARFFLSDEQASSFLHHLSKSAPAEESEPLCDKRAFWNHCRANNLPTVPILAVLSDGSFQRDFGGIRDSLPPQDLFSKPLTASIGRGARKWTYEGEDRFRDTERHVYPPRAVIDALKRQSKKETLLLQPCVYDHPQLQEISECAGPSTLRIITIRRLDGPPEFFAAFLTTPRKPVSAPTFKGQTALAAQVTDAGQLGRLFYKRSAYLPNGREEHPSTGKQMTGLELPHWEEAKSLALKAHTTLPHIACIGWDIILTENGPLLLEGNNDCSAALVQITHQQLLGLTRLPLYLSAHVRAVAKNDTGWTRDGNAILP